MSGIIGVSPDMRSGSVGKYHSEHILQINSVQKDDAFQHTSTSWTAVTGLSVAITPLSLGSKIMVFANILLGSHNAFGTFSAVRMTVDQDGGGYSHFNVGEQRGSNRQRAIGWNQAHHANEVNMVGTNFLWGPSTATTITFRAETIAQSGGYYAFVNRSGSDPDAQYEGQGSSNITVMEIEA